jgi:hypothetical protein
MFDPDAWKQPGYFSGAVETWQERETRRLIELGMILGEEEQGVLLYAED